MVEYKVLEKLIPEMAEILNVMPGEMFRMNDQETLLVLQRRMEECQLKKELLSFNEIFAMQDGITILKLKAVVISFFKLKVLIGAKQKEFTPKLRRELIRELQTQCTKISNILHLLESNVRTADEYQKEQIALTMEKNRAFLDTFHMEIAALEKCMERQLDCDEERKEAEPQSLRRYPKTEEPVWTKPKKKSVLFQIQTYLANVKERKEREEKLKEVEKTFAETRCKEIPFYDHSLVYTHQFVCKDIPAYSILRRKNNIYFGLTKNVGRTSYDNKDQSLTELTEATEEFLQFMEVDLLSGEYELSVFSEKEKEGLTMYFNFLSECFKKHMGETLTVQEYLAFQTYYNKLVLQMFQLEKSAKETYYKALILADAYRSYMEVYDLVCTEDAKTMAEKILSGQHEAYIKDLHLIFQRYIVDEDARADLEELIRKITMFSMGEDIDEEDKPRLIVPKEMEILPMTSQYMGIQQMSLSPVDVYQENMQVVIQILNQEHEVVDEAFYSKHNLKQALFDYENKVGYSKRLGLRSNGQDVFYQEEKENM